MEQATRAGNLSQMRAAECNYKKQCPKKITAHRPMAAGRVTTELRCLVGRLYIRSLDVAESFKHLPQGFELARPNTFDAKVLACLAYCAGRRAERRVEGSQCPAQFTGRPTPGASHPFSQPIAEFDHQIGHESACKPSLSY